MLFDDKDGYLGSGGIYCIYFYHVYQKLGPKIPYSYFDITVNTYFMPQGHKSSTWVMPQGHKSK